MKWKRTIGWALAGLLALLVIAAFCGYFYLRSNNFHQYALRKIVEQADLATGGRTEIGGLDLNLSTLTAHLYDITLRGTEGPDQPALLHADRLTVGIKILSALHRQVALQEVLIDHPVVYLQVSRAGKNNLPVAPASNSGSHTSVFDLAVRHAQLTNGEINYNDRKTPLDADLYNLGVDIHFESLAKRYTGVVSYDNGHVKYAQYAPLPHNLNLKFSASPDRFDLQSAFLKLGSSSVTLHAGVSNYANPVADGEYQIQIHTQDFAAMSPQASPTGDALLSGKLHYQVIGDRPLLQNISVDGRVASEMLTAVASGSRVELRKLRGTYHLAGGDLQINEVAIESFGGRITANAEIKHLDRTPESRVQATLHNISLAALQRAARTQPVPAATVSGSLEGKAEAAWKGSINHLQAQSDLTVKAVAASKSNSLIGGVPVNGAVHVKYDGLHQVVDLHDTTLRIPSATLTAQGTISNHSRLQVQLAATDLHQLATLASSFLSSQSAIPAVSGSATLNAVVSGSIKKPAMAAQLNAQNLEIEGSEWKSASFQMQANPSEFVLQNGSLISARRGQATFSAKLELQNWSYQPSNRIEAHLDAQQIRIIDLQRLANQHYPISGDFSAKVSLQGSQLNPAGSGSAQITNARAYDEPIQTLTAKFNAANGTIASTLNLTVAAVLLTQTFPTLRKPKPTKFVSTRQRWCCKSCRTFKQKISHSPEL